MSVWCLGMNMGLLPFFNFLFFSCARPCVCACVCVRASAQVANNQFCPCEATQANVGLTFKLG